VLQPSADRGQRSPKEDQTGNMESDYVGSFAFYQDKVRGNDYEDEEDEEESQKQFYARKFGLLENDGDGQMKESCATYDDQQDDDSDDFSDRFAEKNVDKRSRIYDYGFEDDDDGEHVDFGSYKKASSSNKKKKSKPKSPKIESTYRMLLKWEVDRLLMNSRSELGMPPIKRSPRHFFSNVDYYSAMKDIAVEEVRALITQSLRTPPQNHNKLSVTLDPCIDEYHLASSSHLVNVRFQVFKGEPDQLRPGCVYKLTYFPPRNSDLSLTPKKRKLEESGSSNKSFTCLAAFSYFQKANGNRNVFIDEEDSEAGFVRTVKQRK
jgi:hypothetical protein